MERKGATDRPEGERGGGEVESEGGEVEDTAFAGFTMTGVQGRGFKGVDVLMVDVFVIEES